MSLLLAPLIQYGSQYLSAASPEEEARALQGFSVLWAKLPKLKQSVPPSIRTDFGVMLLRIAAKGTDLGKADALQTSLAAFALLLLPYGSVDWNHARALAGQTINSLDLSESLRDLEKVERRIKLSSGYLVQSEEAQ